MLETIRLYGPIPAARRHRRGEPARAPGARQEDRAGQGAFRAARADRRSDGGLRESRRSWCWRRSGPPWHEGHDARRAPRSEQEAAAWVRGMFGRVAHRYDLANHLLSFNIDRRWRAHTVKRVRAVLDRPGARVLDICCGTGDLVLALERPRRARAFWAPISATPCWWRARKIAGATPRRCSKPTRCACRSATARSTWSRWPSASATWPTTQPGWKKCGACCAPAAWLRSWSSPSRPTPRSRALYNFYSRRILPWIGGAISGSRDAYKYLPESVRKFPGAARLAEDMRGAGFERSALRIFDGWDRGAARGGVKR